MDIKDIITIIEAVSAAGLTGFELEEDGTRLSLAKKAPRIRMERYRVESPEGQAAPERAAYTAEMIVGQETSRSETVRTGGTAALAAGSGSSEPGAITAEKVVKSPLVGTFYEASSPEVERFVKVGDTVKKGQVLGIIEAMKLMNEIESEYDGIVEAILVNNEEFVEFGQPLFRIK